MSQSISHDTSQRHGARLARGRPSAARAVRRRRRPSRNADDRRGRGGVEAVARRPAASFATVRGDCQDVRRGFPLPSRRRHPRQRRLSRERAAWTSAAELFWMPVDSAGGRIRTTHLDAVAQFRPWASQGFFLKGGAGMAFVRNWVDAIGRESDQLESLIRRHRRRMDASGPPRVSGSRCSARSIWRRSATCRRPTRLFRTSWATSGRSASRL